LKKQFLLLTSFIYYLQAHAQRRSSPRSFEVNGLPDADEVGKYLLIAIPFLLVGFIIAYISWWGKTEEKRNDNSSSANNFGCFGMVLIGIGVVCLVPLLAWVEFIFVSIWSVIFSVIVVVIFIVLIYSVLKKL
jgi:hypothetical protein